MQIDFSSQGHYLIALLPELILATWGLVVLLVGVSRRDGSDAATDLGWMSLAGVLVAALANGWLYGVGEVGSDHMIAVDRFRLFANWVLLGAAALAILISFAYVERQRLQVAEYYGLLLYSVVGMMVMVAARDLIIVNRPTPAR